MKLTVKIISICVFIYSITTIKAFAATVSDVLVSTEGQQTQIVMKLGGTPKIKVFTLQGEPPRVVIDIETATLTKPQVAGTYKGAGSVDNLRFATRGQGMRFVADLSKAGKYTSHVFENGTLRVWIEGKNKPSAKKSTKTQVRQFAGQAYPRLKPVEAVATAKPKQNPPTTKLRLFKTIPVPMLKPHQIRRVVKKPVIVIDPGHGGRDPGSIGVTKVKEETVTLKAALELRKQLLKTGKYRVVLTRTTDTYVVHEKRVRIARKANADLFISIHADSLGNPKTRGASVYTLADRAKNRGHSLVNTKQNWIHDVDLAGHSGAVGDILVNLAQREALSKSDEFAGILIPQLEKRTILLGNTHRQASIYVLIAPDVPAVLLEMGFMSNAKDEKLLNSSKHRAKLMKSVTEAINLYFKAQTRLQ